MKKVTSYKKKSIYTTKRLMMNGKLKVYGNATGATDNSQKTSRKNTEESAQRKSQ